MADSRGKQEFEAFWCVSLDYDESYAYDKNGHGENRF